MNVDRLLRVDQVAEKLNVNPRTIYRIIADAQFRAVRIRGSIRIYESSVRDYLDRKTALFALENGICDNRDNE